MASRADFSWNIDLRLLFSNISLQRLAQISCRSHHISLAMQWNWACLCYSWLAHLFVILTGDCRERSREHLHLHKTTICPKAFSDKIGIYTAIIRLLSTALSAKLLKERLIDILETLPRASPTIHHVPELDKYREERLHFSLYWKGPGCQIIRIRV